MGICNSNENKENENTGLVKNNTNFINLFVVKNVFDYIYDDNKNGIGFFCLIPFPDKKNLLPIMILNDLIIEKNDIIQGKKLNLILGKNKKPLEIQLHANLKLYTNKVFNFTIIENQNNIADYYLQIDDDLTKENLDEVYRFKNINLLYYSFGNSFSHKICKIENINNDSTISYVPRTFGCKIGIIISNSNNKLIGIIRDNEGFLIKDAIEEINGNLKNSKNNKIKKVYFNRKKGIEENDDMDEDIIKRSLSQNPKINIGNKTIGQKLKSSLRRSVKNYMSSTINIKKLALKETNSYNNSNSNSSCTKPLLISLYQILYIRKYLDNQTYRSILTNKNFEISNLICEFFNYYSDKNFQQCEKIVSDLESKINLLNKDIIINSNFEKLIEFILTYMHSELNKRQIMNNNDLKNEDYDENIAFNFFTKKYQDQNDSEIEKTFFGFKERIDNYKCCKLKKYSFEICKFINFNFDENFNNINSNNLQNLISALETKEYPNTKFCSMCNKNSEIFTQQKLIQYPKILVITINNINKKEFQLNTIIRTIKYEYKLICCITESKNENDFNIIYKLNNTWNEIKNDNIEKEIGNEIGSLILYPCALFYEKEDKLISSDNEKKTHKKNISNFSHIYSDINSNNSIDNKDSNIINNTNYNILRNSNDNLQKIKRNYTNNSLTKLYHINLNNKSLNKNNSNNILKKNTYIYDNIGMNNLNGSVMTNPYSTIGNINPYIYNNGMHNKIIYLNKNFYKNKSNYLNYKNNFNNNIYYKHPVINKINIDRSIGNQYLTNSEVKNNILSHTMVINNNKFMDNNNYNYNIRNNLTIINNNMNYNNTLLMNNINHQTTMINPNSNITFL